jgi:hypothetical protein
LDDVADMLARPDLLSEQDVKFLKHVQRATVRMCEDGSTCAYLADAAFGKLMSLVRRFTVPEMAAKFRRKVVREQSMSPDAQAARRAKRLAQQRQQLPRSTPEVSSPDESSPSKHVPW